MNFLDSFWEYMKSWGTYDKKPRFKEIRKCYRLDSINRIFNKNLPTKYDGTLVSEVAKERMIGDDYWKNSK